jgi:hypothetical protein
MPERLVHPRLLRLLVTPAPELRSLLCAGVPVAPDALIGTWRGTILASPRWVRALTWEVFRKVIHRDEHGQLRGHNQRMVQHGWRGPAEPLRRAGRDVTFGPFAVVGPGAAPLPAGCPPTATLDYRGHAPPPLSWIVDPLVALHADEAHAPTLLLGVSALVVAGSAHVTPTWFALERDPLPPGVGARLARAG